MTAIRDSRPEPDGETAGERRRGGIPPGGEDGCRRDESLARLSTPRPSSDTVFANALRRVTRAGRPDLGPLAAVSRWQSYRP